MSPNDPLIHARLYIVGTPIGNLGDISERAVKILSTVDLIAAEDTRHSHKLLEHLGINTPLLALHQFNEDRASDQLIDKLTKGLSIALISDAGTPLIADPGYHLVQRARERGIMVIPVPGPCALITALSASGLPTDKFFFEGFLPVKPGKRQAALDRLKYLTHTLVIYEAPHRILTLLTELVETMGAERHVVVARELTKLFESFVSGTTTEVLEQFESHPETQRGEFVVLVAGAPESSEDWDQVEAERILKLAAEFLPTAAAAKLTAKILKINKNAIYQLSLRLSKP